MVEIHLSLEDEKVLAIIRELYLKNPSPVMTDEIYITCRMHGFDDYLIRRSLISLSSMGLIYRIGDSMSWMPKFELMQEQAIKPSVSFDSRKIMDCMKKLNRPAKPNEILQKFIELYGMPDNVESFLRYIRKCGEEMDTSMVRDGNNNYCMKSSINHTDTTLEMFA